jgi:hypothetical protein
LRFVGDGVWVGVDPVVWRLDAGFDVCMLGEEIEEMCSAEKLKWLAGHEFE